MAAPRSSHQFHDSPCSPLLGQAAEALDHGANSKVYSEFDELRSAPAGARPYDAGA